MCGASKELVAGYDTKVFSWTEFEKILILMLITANGTQRDSRCAAVCTWISSERAVGEMFVIELGPV